MGQLNITRQAITEADCNVILNASMRLSEPLGVPTVLINPTEIPPSSRYSLKRLIHKKLKQALEVARYRPAYSLLRSDRGDTHKGPHYIFRLALDSLTVNRPHPLSLFSYSLPESYPHINGVFFQPIPFCFQEELFQIITPAEFPDTKWPGFDSQHNSFNLWHEYGHGLSGRDEAGADHIAALVCRRVFADCTFLKVQADARAYYTLLSADKGISHIEHYGWPCVEAIDNVVAMTQPPSWPQIDYISRTIHSIPRKFQTNEVLAIYNKMAEKCDGYYDEQSLGTVADILDDLIDHNAFDEPMTNIIAQRFTLAARRLSRGLTAYYDKPPVSDEQTMSGKRAVYNQHNVQVNLSIPF